MNGNDDVVNVCDVVCSAQGLTSRGNGNDPELEIRGSSGVYKLNSSRVGEM